MRRRLLVGCRGRKRGEEGEGEGGEGRESSGESDPNFQGVGFLFSRFDFSRDPSEVVASKKRKPLRTL